MEVLRGLITPKLILASFVVALLSFALDQYPADIDPHEYAWKYEEKTLKQREQFKNALPALLQSEFYDQGETVFANEALAAEDLVVTADGKTAFMGLMDGRIVSFTLEDNRVLRNFSRTGDDLPSCGLSFALEPQCGRPLGMIFANSEPFAKYLQHIQPAELFPEDQVLLVADAYKGVLLFDATGKQTLLFDSVNGKKMLFLNGIDVADGGKSVYVTDSSQRFHRNRVIMEFLEAKQTGRLLHFDPVSGQVQVLAENLGMPNGVLTLRRIQREKQDEKEAEEGLLIALTTQNKIVKYDFATKKLQDFAFLPFSPDNLSIVKTNEGNEVLLAALVGRPPFWFSYLLQSAKMRKLLSLLPPQVTIGVVAQKSVFISLDLQTGDILHVFEDTTGKAPLISGVKAFGDHLYLLSWLRRSLLCVPASALE